MQLIELLYLGTWRYFHSNFPVLGVPQSSINTFGHDVSLPFLKLRLSEMGVLHAERLFCSPVDLLY